MTRPEIEMKFHEEHQVWYGVEGDPYVFTEQRRDYKRIADRADGANVLEFGAHCGFHNVFLRRTVKPNLIVSVEANPELMPILRANTEDDYGLTIPYNAAVVDQSYEGEEMDLYLHYRFTAAASPEPFARREKISVPTVSFQKLLDLYNINYIKCDCEGGEYGLDWSSIPDRVDSIAIEFHFHRSHWQGEMQKIDDTLLSLGFEHIKKPKVNTFQKVNIGLYKRDL